MFAALVFLIDRVVAPRLPPVLATLVFPAVLLSVLYVGYLASPFGTWGDIAYTQTGFPLLLQSVSVAGIWGITFLVAWFAAIANLVLEQGVAARPSRVAGAMLVSALTVVLIFGAVSLQGYKPDATITVATVAAAPDEDDFLRRARGFAQENEIYLFVGLLLYPATPEDSLQNRLVAINPEGDIGWDYHKAKPVPGERIVAGDGQLPVLDTPFGRITGMICFDADFPALARQAAELRADLLLVAANDWAEIEQVHADMAVVRAVEHDVSLLRATSGGISVAATGTGKRVTESGASNPIMIVTLPLNRQHR